MVGVAQLVEHQVVVLGVEGSIPSAHPIFLYESSKKACERAQNELQYYYHFLCNCTCRDVAQLVAHSLWERGVASSSLAIPTIFLSKYDPSFSIHFHFSNTKNLSINRSPSFYKKELIWRFEHSSLSIVSTKCSE